VVKLRAHALFLTLQALRGIDLWRCYCFKRHLLVRPARLASKGVGLKWHCIWFDDLRHDVCSYRQSESHGNLANAIMGGDWRIFSAGHLLHAGWHKDRNRTFGAYWWWGFRGVVLCRILKKIRRCPWTKAMMDQRVSQRHDSQYQYEGLHLFSASCIAVFELLERRFRKVPYATFTTTFPKCPPLSRYCKASFACSKSNTRSTTGFKPLPSA